MQQNVAAVKMKDPLRGGFFRIFATAFTQKGEKPTASSICKQCNNSDWMIRLLATKLTITKCIKCTY